MNKLRQKLKI